LTEHSELATLDFDHVSDPNFIRDFIFDSYKFVYSAFISPSGDGVKVLVRIPKVKNDEEYKQYYTVLLNYFDSATSDQATKDISRICFISYDPDLRLREWNDTSIFVQKYDPKDWPNEIVKQPINIRNRDRALNTAAKMIRECSDGDKHFTLLKASRLLGGYVAGGSIDYDQAVELLESEIKNKSNVKSLKDAQTSIKAGLKYGQLSPIKNEYQNYATESKITIDSTLEKIKDKPLIFPVEIYPDQLQTLIKELNRCLNYPTDFTASGLLSIFSTIIRNSLRVEVKSGYTDSACIWLMQIGEPGSAKSYPLKTLFSPLQEIESELMEHFKRQYSEWEAGEEKGIKPKLKELIIKDFTLEMLCKTLDFNIQGVGLYLDELKGWINGMGKYTKGQSNDIQTWLSIFGGDAIKVTRKTQEIPLYVKNPFVSVAGTIQPDELITVNKSHSGDGFFDRFLYCYPQIQMEKRSRDELDINVINQYNINIKSIITVFNDMILESDKPTILKFTSDAFELYYKIDDWLVDVALGQNTNVALRSYISKLRTYLPRLSLIIEVINTSFLGYVAFEIERKSVADAGKLIQYFYHNAELIYGKFNESDEVKEYISTANGKSKQIKYLELFEKGVKIKEIAKIFKVSESTIKTSISREKQKTK
jgi:hypothetical protein